MNGDDAQAPTDGQGTAANQPPADGQKPSDAQNVSGASGNQSNGNGGMGGASYHMASFDYAYNCVAVMEWLFAQK